MIMGKGCGGRTGHAILPCKLTGEEYDNRVSGLRMGTHFGMV